MATTVGAVVFSIAADIKDIQGQLRTLQGNFQGTARRIQGSLRNVAGAIGIGFGIGQLVAFGKGVVDLAGHLTDLADQTGISAQTLSGMQSTLEEAGTSVDAFAKAIFNAQKNIGEIRTPTDEVARAVRALGLNLDELRNANPERFLEIIADALGKVENPVERAALGAKLLGKQFKDLAPALSQISGRLQELRAQGITEEDLRKLDEFGDAWTRMANRVKIASAGFLADAIRDLERIAELVRLNTAGLNRILGGEGAIIGGTREFPGLAGAEDIIKAALKPTQGGGLFRGITDETKKQIDLVGNFFRQLDADLARIESRRLELTIGPEAALGFNLDRELDELKRKLADAKLPVPANLEERFAAIRERIIGANDSLRELEQSLKTLEAFDLLDAEQGVAGLQRFQREAARTAAGLNERLTALRQDLSVSLLPEDQRGIERVRQEFEERRKLIEDWRQASIDAGNDVEVANARAAEMLGLVSRDASAKIGELRKSTDELTKFQERAFERMHDALADATRDFISGEIKSWEELGDRIKRVIDDIVAEWLAMQLKIAVIGKDFGKPGGQVGGIVGSALRLIGGFFGGGGFESTAFTDVAGPGTSPIDVLDMEFALGRRHGGPVVPGKAYMVGESGPELFVPDVSGRIEPDISRAGTGMVENHYHFNIATPDVPGFRRALMQVKRVATMAIDEAQRRGIR